MTDAPIDERSAPGLQLMVRQLGQAAADACVEACDRAHNPAHADCPLIMPAIWQAFDEAMAAYQDSPPHETNTSASEQHGGRDADDDIRADRASLALTCGRNVLGRKTVAKPTVDNPQALTLDVFHKTQTDESVAAPVPEEGFHAAEFGGSGTRRCNEQCCARAFLGAPTHYVAEAGKFRTRSLGERARSTRGKQDE